MSTQNLQRFFKDHTQKSEKKVEPFSTPYHPEHRYEAACTNKKVKLSDEDERDGMRL